MRTEIELLMQLLNCWYRDIEFLLKLLNKISIELDIERIKSEYWLIDINSLIHYCLSERVKLFFEQYRGSIENILRINNLYDFLSENDFYNVYVNFFDSSISFNNNIVQKLFNNSEYWF